MRGSRFIQLALPAGKGFVLKMMEEQASALTVHQISHDRLSLANPQCYTYTIKKKEVITYAQN